MGDAQSAKERQGVYIQYAYLSTLCTVHICPKRQRVSLIIIINIYRISGCELFKFHLKAITNHNYNLPIRPIRPINTCQYVSTSLDAQSAKERQGVYIQYAYLSTFMYSTYMS